MDRPTLADALFRPRAIALIGASDTPGRHNSRPQQYLAKHGYPGAVYPVNPRRETVYGVRAYPSVLDLPRPVDHAFVMTPAASVPEVIRQCGAAGIVVATVFTADFAETGVKGRALQDAVAEAGREAGVRIVGPNCIGVIATDPPAPITANTIMNLPELTKGRLGVISQSGSLTGTFISRGQARGLGFSKLVSSGNECDLKAGELAEILVDDDGTDAVLMFLETVRDADRLAAAARRAWDKGKPIVVYKLGRSAAAADFAASHTGAIAGTDAALDSFFRQHGILRVEMFETLFELPNLAIGRRPRPGRRVSVATTTGGGGGMAVDRMGLAGLIPTPLPQDAVDRLAARGINLSNGPVIDLTFAGASYTNTTAVLQEMLASPANDAVVMVVGSSSQFHPEVAVKPLVDLPRPDKPFGAFLVPEATDSMRLLAQAGVAAFRTPETCADALRAFFAWTAPVPAAPPPPDLSQASALLDSAQDGTLDEAASRAVFAALGVPQAPSMLLRESDPTDSVAASVGFPVAAKIVSPDIPHKTEAGGVVLGIADAGGLEAARRDILAAVRAHAPTARIGGVLVQRMERGLAEVLVGYRVDPLVGPTVVLGLGGVLAELYADVTVRLAPVSSEQAYSMIEGVKALAPVRGYRGLPKGDLDALAAAIVAVSNLAHLPQVREAEINPLIVRKADAGVAAVDGLIVLGSENVSIC